MWKRLWIIIALVIIAVTAEPAVDNEEHADDTREVNRDQMDINIPGIDKELPSPEEFLKMLDSMSNLSDEEKESLREYISKTPEGLKNITAGGEKSFMYQMLLLFSMLTVISVIFVFFGYKLYKNLIERDIRREMKKKQKELKKKK
ncbi:uncharacterized protein [Chelonus insularis]|uniref:uncharacterized protein n=1 Tax=Chelonus insularis TaxID=460826 RepID=UPI00158D8838|nr:uncharacterized protein LOC118066179 [Chelonus insularis]XP_034937905.1 uncharacterized protein LOC118066179 [Chelonus insularis]